MSHELAVRGRGDRGVVSVEKFHRDGKEKITIF
jgi:hypothetical protein